MTRVQLSDPYNLIIAGVGGQGNILASKMLGSTLIRKGLIVTTGESLGGTQRGGSVSSHMRISAESSWSPQVPLHAAQMVLGLEPTETLRVLAQYGNPEVKVVCNMRPVHPVSVITGEAEYPKAEDLRRWIEELSSECWFLNATDEAMKMGRAIYLNIIMIGALAGIGVLPLDRDAVEAVITETMSPDKIAVNLKAFDLGRSMVA